MEHESIENAPRGAKTSPASDTGNKLVERGKATRFRKGHDPRRNLNGRPRTFDQARALAQAIAHEELTLQDGRKITVAEAVLRSWAKSPEPQLQKAFIEYCFGKVPDKVETTGLENKTTLVLHYGHQRPAPNGDRRLPAGLSQGAN